MSIKNVEQNKEGIQHKNKYLEAENILNQIEIIAPKHELETGYHRAESELFGCDLYTKLKGFWNFAKYREVGQMFSKYNSGIFDVYMKTKMLQHKHRIIAFCKDLCNQGICSTVKLSTIYEIITIEK